MEKYVTGKCQKLFSQKSSILDIQVKSKYASEFYTYFSQYKWLKSTKDHLYVESFRTKILKMTLNHKNLFKIYGGRDSIQKHGPKPQNKNLAY